MPPTDRLSRKQARTLAHECDRALEAHAGASVEFRIARNCPPLHQVTVVAQGRKGQARLLAARRMRPAQPLGLWTCRGVLKTMVDFCAKGATLSCSTFFVDHLRLAQRPWAAVR